MESLFQKKICSPAKINLHLAVGEKRPDGFHDIESIFVPVSLCDHIDLAVSRSATVSITIRGMEDGVSGGMPLEHNLMYRAAFLFSQETGLAFSLRIAIEKTIPLGAGLGGGSSNAAAILGALNEAAGFPLSHDALMETAARLGSDVPFFIEGKPAFVSGRGEHVAPFAVDKDLFFVLVKPAFASETAEAYRLLDERRSALQASSPRDSVLREAVSPETLIAALKKPPSAWPYRNDFQSVFLDDRHPHSGEYRAIFSALHGTGASFTLLSGSGSTVFGVYESADAAEAAATAVASLCSEQGESRRGKAGKRFVLPAGLLRPL
ncbi:MAG: 4-(cytidine 5'-diphospho)-2-C-methyl-D-erythritol kinase [Spirochaetaceae bacterium]|jgi:4-diphosphocytidyl-2-C-methyl-D-erythritol kinase|nr:4-(cytidine 5'-diphospho)-2-C-methyl-D-erythritol kinase [Spirochaetaceae bacterium]